MQKYQWNLLERQKEDLVDHLLYIRGIRTAKEKELFLSPDWDKHTFDPMQFTRMNDAVKAVFSALEKEEKIMIHGDYDADGVSGSTLLYSVLTDIAKKANYSTDNIQVFLPDREKDGYGVAMHTIERFGKEGIQLLITVDCGIANAKQLNYAHELGMEVIICDHHQLGEKLPAYAMIIHPLAPGEVYPNKHLCGTGVAFKLAQALIFEARNRGMDFLEGYEKWYLDLVAIATVTDVMPITGENRVLEKYGLLVLNKTKREGLKKIIVSSRSELGKIDTTAIGFRIGPRLNAAGRISSAQTAFDALSAQHEEEASRLALKLETLNSQRRSFSDKAFQEAKLMVEASSETPSIQVIWNENWLPGIVGLIAGKLVSEFGVPTFALTKSGDHYVGSGRSIGGLNLVEAMNSCGDIFIKAGGHPEACGLSIQDIDQLHLFKERVEKYADDFFGGETKGPVIDIDAQLPVNLVDWDIFWELERLKPFGQGNRRPIFMAENLQIIAADRMGSSGKHLRISVNPEGGVVTKMIGFNIGDIADQLFFGDMVDIAYEIFENEWNGKKDIQFQIKDIRKNSG